MRRRIILLFVTLSGCHTAGANSLVGAALMTPAAIGAAAISRAAGACYANCTTGTVCNEKTGLCERLPCRGFCPSDQRCDEATDTCVSTEGPALGVGKEHETDEKNPPPVKWKQPEPIEPQPPK